MRTESEMNPYNIPHHICCVAYRRTWPVAGEPEHRLYRYEFVRGPYQSRDEARKHVSQDEWRNGKYTVLSMWCFEDDIEDTISEWHASLKVSQFLQALRAGQRVWSWKNGCEFLCWADYSPEHKKYRLHHAKDGDHMCTEIFYSTSGFWHDLCEIAPLELWRVQE